MGTNTPKWKPLNHIFYGWWLVGITIFTMMVVITPVFQGLGFFFVALERQFQWSRTVLSIPLSLARAEGALLGPIEGFLIDRVGSRRMILIGFMILGAGFVAFSFIDSVLGYYVSFLVIFAGAGLGGFLPLITALNNWFLRHRSKAMGIGMLGVSLGGLLAPALGQAIEVAGWRDVALWLGIFFWILAIPISSMVRNRPEDYDQHPDGDPEPDFVTIQASMHRAELQDAPSFTVREALRTPAFWAITVAHASANLASFTLAVHLVPALTDRGMSFAMAGTVLLTFGVIGALFQVIGGYVGDRVAKTPASAVFIAIQGAGVLSVALIHTVQGAFLFAVLYGAGFGGRIPLLTSLRGDFFGRKNFATIYGISQAPINLISMVAPIAAGFYFDTFHSYTIPFLALALFSFLGAFLILLARKPRLPDRQPAQFSPANV